jgi:hypothetical protein
MAGPTARAQFGAADPNTAPISFNDVINQLNQLALDVALSGGPFSAFVKGPSTSPPQVSDQDKIWFVTDQNGRPLEIRLFYLGQWRRFYTGKGGKIEMFSGNPATYFDSNHVGFNLGTVIGTGSTDWDGWVLCTPTGHAQFPNLVPDLSDRFIVGSGTYNTTFGWQSKVGDGTTLLSNDPTDHPGVNRGNSTHLIINSDLPGYTLAITGHEYNAVQAAKAFSSPIVDFSWAGAPVTQTLPSQNSAVDTPPNTIGAVPPIIQTPLQVSPPYYVLAFAAWKGYA